MSRADPIGVCSIAVNGGGPAITCPVRFRQDGIVINDAARLAFGEGASFFVISELPMMVNVLTGAAVGQVDWVAVHVEDGELRDFCLIEVQAVYVSGASYVPAFRSYMNERKIEDVRGHPDYRSSHVKRLLPQLALKVPVVRRWGKKVFVAVDESFYQSFPDPPFCNIENSEVTWLVYGLAQAEDQARLELVKVVPTLLDDSVEALYSIVPPTRTGLEAIDRTPFFGPLVMRVLVGCRSSSGGRTRRVSGSSRIGVVGSGCTRVA
ncbi:MAG TPA: NotI family restriction endonuclease, partial [Gaiellaceae bacterium]